jgi:hypothetical protein
LGRALISEALTGLKMTWNTSGRLKGIWKSGNQEKLGKDSDGG